MLDNVTLQTIHWFFKHLGVSWAPDVVAQTETFTSSQYSEEIDAHFKVHVCMASLMKVLPWKHFVPNASLSEGFVFLIFHSSHLETIS